MPKVRAIYGPFCEEGVAWVFVDIRVWFLNKPIPHTTTYLSLGGFAYFLTAWAFLC